MVLKTLLSQPLEVHESRVDESRVQDCGANANVMLLLFLTSLYSNCYDLGLRGLGFNTTGACRLNM